MQMSALDGGLAEVSASKIRFDPAFTASGTAVLGGKWQSFAAGPIGLGRDVAADHEFGIVEFDEEYRFQDGNLLLGTGIAPVGPDGAEYAERAPDGTVQPLRRRLAVWEGTWHSLYTQVYGKNYDILMSLLSNCLVMDSPSGITVSPREPTPRFWAKPTRVAKWIPEIGLIDVLKRTSEVESKIPPWGGTRVRSGQLYVAKKGHPEMYFVLAGKSTLTWISPSAARASDKVVDQLAELDVTWSDS